MRRQPRYQAPLPGAVTVGEILVGTNELHRPGDPKAAVLYPEIYQDTPQDTIETYAAEGLLSPETVARLRAEGRLLPLPESEPPPG